MEHSIHNQFESLIASDYQIVDGEPEIIGWPLRSDVNTILGTVADLLFNLESRSVKYLIISLEHNNHALDSQKVSIPIDLVEIDSKAKAVILPHNFAMRLSALPPYNITKFTADIESHIRETFECINDRTEQQQTIHKLVKRANPHNHHAPHIHTHDGRIHQEVEN